MKDLQEQLIAYHRSDVYPFHMPGHKRQELPFPNPYGIDITEVDGFDNLHQAEGILKEAQQRAADLYGARRTFYLVNGSTCGLLAAISAATKKRDKVLVARNCHKAVYHALYLRELSAEYLYPQITGMDLQGQITAEQVKEALEKHPDSRAVVITSPTYEGIVSDVAGIAEVAHRYGVPLIVDSAHGAHFGFGGGFPDSAVTQGADAVIMSLHKTLPSFTQTALLHLCSERISEEEVARYLGIFETSSPSYLFMAGMDRCIGMIREQGVELFLRYRSRLDRFYREVADLKHLHVLTGADLSDREAYDWDDSKLVVFTGDSGMSGEELHQQLLDRFHLQMEMVSASYVLGMTSIMDTEEGFARFADALQLLDAECEVKYSGEQLHEEKVQCPEGQQMSGQEVKPAQDNFIRRMYEENPRNMEIWEAVEQQAKEVSFDEAVGQMSAEYVYLYPPGIPMLVPGEVITGEFVGKMRECLGQGLNLQSGSNLSSERIKIVYF